MVIAIIILSVLFAFALAAIGILYYVITVLIDLAFDNNPREMTKEYFARFAKEGYDCTLMLTFQEHMGYDGAIFDFSRYEDNGIIMMVECYKGKSTNPKDNYYNEDGTPNTVFIPNQKVWLMQDGSYQWDITPYL